MKPPPLPRPLTPQYAEHLAKRWKWAGYAFGGCAIALAIVGLPAASAIPALLAFVVLLEARSLQGWAGGYRACHRSHCEIPAADEESP